MGSCAIAPLRQSLSRWTSIVIMPEGSGVAAERVVEKHPSFAWLTYCYSSDVGGVGSVSPTNSVSVGNDMRTSVDRQLDGGPIVSSARR
jgi:hypothetical protein